MVAFSARAPVVALKLTMERRILVERLHYVVPITDVSTLDEGIKKDKKLLLVLVQQLMHSVLFLSCGLTSS
ncbi:hypothetical protein VLG1_16210 [Lactobacillus paragasseri]